MAVLPLMDLPPRLNLRAAFAKLAHDHRRAVACSFAGVVPPGGGSVSRTRGMQVMERDLASFQASLLPYLDAHLARVADPLFAPVDVPLPAKGGVDLRLGVPLPASPPKGGATASLARSAAAFRDQWTRGVADARLRFADLCRGPLHAPYAAQVDALERQLTPALPPHLLVGGVLLEEARREFLAWMRFVRLGIAVALVGSLPYEEVWGRPTSPVCRGQDPSKPRRGIYGTAGWALAGELPLLAAEVRATGSWARARDAFASFPWMEEHFTFAAASGAAVPLAAGLERAEREAAEWQAIGPTLPVNEQGIRGPFRFERIPGTHGDHMFARPRALQRILAARDHWDWLVATRGYRHVRGDRTIEFRITAATLEHGGAHPPHTSHRNGANFDVAIGAALPVTCGGVTVEGATIVLQASEGASPEPLYDGDEAPRARICFQPTHPQGRVRANGRAVDTAEVSRKAVACLLLTFPSQVLFASWETLRDAQREVLDAIQRLHPAADEEGRAALEELRDHLGPRAPADRPLDPERGPRPWGMLVPRDDHHDHWHVSYLPSEVEAPTPERGAALAWLEANRARLLDGPAGQRP